jgi:hypothetical protein
MFCRLPLNAARPTATLDTTAVRPQLRARRLHSLLRRRRSLRVHGSPKTTVCSHSHCRFWATAVSTLRVPPAALRRARVGPRGRAVKLGRPGPARRCRAARREVAVRRQPGMPGPRLGTVACPGRVISARLCTVTPAARDPVRKSPAKRGPCCDRGWAPLAAGWPIEEPPSRQLQRTWACL